jgi:hypothetical protein
MNTEIPGPPVVNMRIWYGSSGPLPNRAQFVCAYEMGFGVDDRRLAVLIRMALMYADADAVKRAELLDLCMTCWRQAQFFAAGRVLRLWPVLA